MEIYRPAHTLAARQAAEFPRRTHTVSSRTVGAACTWRAATRCHDCQYLPIEKSSSLFFLKFFCFIYIFHTLLCRCLVSLLCFGVSILFIILILNVGFNFHIFWFVKIIILFFFFYSSWPSTSIDAESASVIGVKYGELATLPNFE